MGFWLVKSEPGTWSWEDHHKAGTDVWTGVRNFQAMANLKAMKPGEKVFFYHSGETKAVVGVSEVVRGAYPDPTDKDGKFVAVDLKAVSALKRPVTLAEIKADSALSDMVLVRNSRLSVQAVSPAQWERISQMAGG